MGTLARLGLNTGICIARSEKLWEKNYFKDLWKEFVCESSKLLHFCKVYCPELLKKIDNFCFERLDQVSCIKFLYLRLC